jgi:hypothetical protein
LLRESKNIAKPIYIVRCGVRQYPSEHSSVGRAPDCSGLRSYQAVSGSNPDVRTLFYFGVDLVII